jgi:phosphatidylserine/phosphatidylglycerophosphate/cardiolipin synthase-like enzyme
MRPKVQLLIVLTFALLMGLSAIVLAVGGDPQTLFTDNVTATGTTIAVTEMEQQLLNRLNAATNSIDAAIYSLDRVSIRNALIAAHNRGVTVRVVADDDAYNDADYNPHFAALQVAGIPVILDNRSSLMHNKFFVIDGLIVWTGSTNITNTGFTYNHNNSLVFTSSQVANIYTTEFDEMFVSGLFGTAKTDNTTHTLTYAGSLVESYFSPTDGAMGQVIDEVNAADQGIYFAIFSFTDDSLRDAIIARAQAGVTVQGIFDRLMAGNQYSDDEALCAAGIPIKIEDFGGVLHDKFMVIDTGGTDPVVVTGSMNWSASGGEDNDENTLIIHDLETAQAYLAAFQELYNALGSETLCTGGGAQVFLPIVMSNYSSGTPPTQDVQITYIEYDPPGDDVQGEYVRIENLGGSAANMTDWTLRDESNHVFIFPSFTLAPAGTVQVWTRAGTNDASNLYWGSGSAIWNNTGDCAYLQDGSGEMIWTYCY